MSEPNGNGSGDPDGNGSSHGHGSSLHGNRGSDGNGNSPVNGNQQEGKNPQEGGGGLNGDRGSNENGDPQIEEQDLPEKMGTHMDGMEVLTLMIVGMGMILHPHQTPHCPGREGIGDPNMFMYCKGLQGHGARKGYLDNLDRQREMAEMGKPHH